MFRIGELARRAHVTVKTLHHYDDIDLLKPAHVDPQTGYRYYTPGQADDLDRIVAFKGLGLSLEQIGFLLERDPSDETVKQVLSDKQSELRKALQDVQARLTRVESELRPTAEMSGARSRTRKDVSSTEESTMSQIEQITEDGFGDFTERLEKGRADYLPMIFGTTAESIAQTEWLDSFSDQYAYLVDPVLDGECAYVMRRADHRASLWFTLIMPSDWERRFDILDASLPNVIGWFRENDAYRYLFSQLGVDNTPPTVLDAFLPTFLHHGFKTEYRMEMHRPAGLGIPDPITVPDGVEEVEYSDDMRNELAEFASAVYIAEGVTYNLEDAQRCVWRDIEDEFFQESASFLRADDGNLVGAIWWSADEEPYLGEFLVASDEQGRGYGRYLLNKTVRHMKRRFPNKSIRLNTCREWARARSLYESYGFRTDRMYTNLNMPKLAS